MRMKEDKGMIDDAHHLLNKLNAMMIPHLFQQNDWTPLFIASCKGHIGVVEALVNANADVNYETKASQSTRRKVKVNFIILQLILIKISPLPQTQSGWGYSSFQCFLWRT